jgi:hypothetical protein
MDDAEVPVVFEPVGNQRDDVGQIRPRLEAIELHDHRVGDKDLVLLAVPECL